MKKLLPFLVFPLLPAHAIVGGREVVRGSPEQYATVAVLGTRDDGRTEYCSGTLLARDLVLTAAHCLERTTRVQVHFNPSVNLRTIDDRREVRESSLHPSYLVGRGFPENHAAGTFDLALLRLDRPAPAPYRTVALPTAEDLLTLNRDRRYVAYGYGQQSTRPRTPVGYLVRKEQALQRPFAASAARFETRNRDGETCGGDSGGPALLAAADGREVVVGVVSGGEHSRASLMLPTLVEGCRGASFYVNVYAALDWINGQL